MERQGFANALSPGLLLALVCAAGLAGCSGRTSVSTPFSRPMPIPRTPLRDLSGGIRFHEIARAAGISYSWPAPPRPVTIGDAMGCGCAFLDFDNDGWQDILLVARPHALLYRNLRNGHFLDITRQSGLAAVTGDWRGVAVGDVDGDGRLDILLTGYHRLALLKNVDGKHFVDITRRAGLDPSNRGHWASSAGFMDLDGDGWLDLVLLNYVSFGPGDRQYCELKTGVRSGCPPRDYHPEFPEVWKNLGHGRFREVTATAGLGAAHGNGLALAFCDLTGDGRPDFFLGNDTLPSDLMLNDGHGHYRDIAAAAGVATGIMSQPVAAMGADWGDYDRDGRWDLIVPDFSNELFELFHNQSSGRRTGGEWISFDHAGAAAGVVKATYGRLGFGAKWIDMDNDGWPDLAIADGHVYDNPGRIYVGAEYREPITLLRNQHGKQFIDIGPDQEAAMQQPIVGRGLATGDFDNDGRMDLLVVDREGPALLCRNTTNTGAHWLTLDLRGYYPNRFAYGAEITARAGGDRWDGQVSPASSYLSSSDPRVHFGLGKTRVLDRVSIHWPDGRREILSHVAADRIWKIQEGAQKS